MGTAISGKRGGEPPVAERDVRQLLRCLNELHELARAGHDPRAHHLACLCQLVGAERAGLASVQDFRVGGRGSFTTLVVAGFDGSRSDVAWLMALESQGAMLDPLARSICRRGNREVLAVQRSELLDDRAWEQDPYVQELVTPVGIHDPVYCWVPGPTGGGDGFGVSFHRSRGARRFSPREVQLAALFLQESLQLLAPRAPGAGATPADDLPRRLRETLQALLEGLREKEVAARLGLSELTVHGYVKDLYRRFGVHSRVELMARLAPQRPAARTPTVPPLEKRGAAHVRLLEPRQNRYLPHALDVALPAAAPPGGRTPAPPV